jgi:transposase
VEQTGALAEAACRAGQHRRRARSGHDRQFGRQGSSLRLRRKRGERDQAIGRSRGGRTTKIHALVDGEGRPHAILLTGGQVADIKGAAALVTATAPSGSLVGDKAYDVDQLRALLRSRGTAAVIPNKITRVNRHPFDPLAYKARNVIERTFCRLKDFRRIATRYDKLARNFLAGLCLVVAICYWIN